MAEHLDRHAACAWRGPSRAASPGSPRRRRRSGVQVREVDRLRVRPERLERHRLLHVRAAQLAHPHVERHLAALVAGLALVAGARARALLAAPGGLAVAGALAAADALACGGASRPWRLEAVEADSSRRAIGSLAPSRDARPRGPCRAPSGRRGARRSLPILRRPSVRSVPRWLGFGAVRDLTCGDLHVRAQEPSPSARRPLAALVGLASSLPSRLRSRPSTSAHGHAAQLGDLLRARAAAGARRRSP